ncbi:ATP-grasp domain-containing protein [Methylobacter sp.]|uniref:ATP-grasp domain-containing protein n=1 Tax=Methylobacter sp. TaxID=2051955 RepID=UPI002FDE4138
MSDRDNSFNNVKLGEDGLVAILPISAISRKTPSDIPQMLTEASSDKDPGNLFMRMFYLLSALGQDEMALEMQSDALRHRSIYRVVSPPDPKIRLLAVIGPGNMTDNAPIDFLVEQSDIQLDLLFVSSENNLPSTIPDHDIALVALGESDKNNPILDKIGKMLHAWPRPYINDPEKILNCARNKTSLLLQNIAGLVAPKTYRMHREQLRGFTFPITIRPIDTHSGKGFKKINDAAELKLYLEHDSENDDFYISEFIEYQSDDGCYRKLRIALIDRKPFICHLAISESWIVHYSSSGMELSERKRAEEQAVMENFDHDFAARHREALFAIADRLDLDYVVIDCAETGDGELLLFEADPRGWVHATDPVDIFPYKPAVMQKAFAAFRSLLLKRSSLE